MPKAGRLLSRKRRLSQPGVTACRRVAIATNRRVQDISVTKVWQDSDDKSGKRPDSVTVSVKANGAEIEQLTLSADNQWSAVLEDQPIYENGKPISYTVEETPVPEDYKATVSGSAASGFVITNAYETRDISVQKVWQDENDRDGLRPAAVTVKLLADDTDTGRTICCTAVRQKQAGLSRPHTMPEKQGQERKMI